MSKLFDSMAEFVGAHVKQQKEMCEIRKFRPDPPPCETCAGLGETPGFSNEFYTCPKCNGTGYVEETDTLEEERDAESDNT